jgi:putative flippase GtrA
MRQEFVRFLLVGVTNTLLSYLLYLLLLIFLTYLPAYSIAYCGGIIVSYFLNVKFVFKKSITFISFLKFPMVYLIQYALGLFILWLLVGEFSISPEFSIIGAVIVTIPVTFLASRFALKS